MNTLEQIKNNAVYQQILADSFGGIMYDVANYGKYQATELLELWDGMSASEQESAGGIVKGAICFCREN